MEQLVEAQSEKQSAFMKVITQISRTMAAVGAASLFVMMAITVIDVGGRNIFLKPLNGSFELVGMMLIIAGSWGMGYCQLLGMNIRIGLFVDKFSKRWKWIMAILMLLLSGVVAGLVAWQEFVKTGDLLTSKLGNITETLGMPLWPFTLMLAVGFVWAGFVFFVQLYQQFVGASKNGSN
jgi:TRAP-type C4-dicarboxylate transport system permease small subunit